MHWPVPRACVSRAVRQHHSVLSKVNRTWKYIISFEWLTEVRTNQTAWPQFVQRAIEEYITASTVMK